MPDYLALNSLIYNVYFYFRIACLCLTVWFPLNLNVKIDNVKKVGVMIKFWLHADDRWYAVRLGKKSYKIILIAQSPLAV